MFFELTGRKHLLLRVVFVFIYGVLLFLFFQYSVRYAKMLIIARRSREIPMDLACALVAALSERAPFLRTMGSDFSQMRKQRDSDAESAEEEEEEEQEPPGERTSWSACA